MSHKQASPPVATNKHVRRSWLLPVLMVLTVLAVGVNLFRWFAKPTLEPLPIVATQQMTPQIGELIQKGTAEVRRQEGSVVAWGDLGAVFLVHQITPEAAVCFRNAERLDSGDYRWSYLLGVSLVYLDGDQSLSAFRRAAERCGERAHVQLRLAETLLDRGDLTEATAQIDRVLAYAPSHPRAQFAKARLLVAQGNYEEARPWAERSADAADKQAPCILLAQICRRTSDAAGEAKALAALQQIPDGPPLWEDPEIAALSPLCQDLNARLERVKDLTTDGQSVMLKETLHEMAAEGDGASAIADLAGIFVNEGKFRQSETLLRRHLSDSPNDERLQFLVGVACFHQEKYAVAEAEFRRTVELKPDYFEAWYHLGVTLVKLGKQSNARDAFAATVRLRPRHAAARLSLADLLLAEGKREQAREHLDVAIKVAPGDQHALRLLARAKTEEK